MWKKVSRSAGWISHEIVCDYWNEREKNGQDKRRHRPRPVKFDFGILGRWKTVALYEPTTGICRKFAYLRFHLSDVLSPFRPITKRFMTRTAGKRKRQHLHSQQRLSALSLVRFRYRGDRIRASHGILSTFWLLRPANARASSTSPIISR